MLLFDRKSDSKFAEPVSTDQPFTEALENFRRGPIRVEWLGIGLIAASLAVATVGISVVARVGIRTGRGRNRPTSIRKAEGEFQRPEPPEGRYWG
jgi:hypothetical protein